MADRTDWGLTELGFRRPSFAEILDGLEHQARETLTTEGKTPNLTVRSPFGMLLRIGAWMIHLLFQLLEDVYNSQFVDTAVGASLYQIGRKIGMKLRPAQRSSGYVAFSGTPGTAVPLGYLVGTAAGIQFSVVMAGILGEDGTATLPIRCTQLGSIGNVAEGTITQIINPLEGIQEASNPQEITGGRAKETDEEFRDRYSRSVDLAGGVNADAIQATILQEVEGVLAARVYENDSDEADSRGLPPHSIEAVVYAGLDLEVAKAIYKKAAGIQTWGTTTVEITSPQNRQIYPICFTRPTGIPIWIKLEALQVDDKRFPADGPEQLQKALSGYIGNDLTGGLNIGEDVIYNQLPCRIYSVPGVIDFSMTISLDGKSYSKSNTPISDREKAVLEEERIIIMPMTMEEG